MLETPSVVNQKMSGSISIQTGSFQEGASGEVMIGTGSAKLVILPLSLVMLET